MIGAQNEAVLKPLPDGWRERLQELWPNAARLDFAFRLAPDLETCRALLAGEPVEPSRLDQAELERARQLQLVRFDETRMNIYNRLFSIREAT